MTVAHTLPMSDDRFRHRASSVVPIVAVFGSAGIVAADLSWGIWAVLGFAVYVVVNVRTRRHLRSERGQSSRWGPALRAVTSPVFFFVWYWFASWVLVRSVWMALPIALGAMVVIGVDEWFWRRGLGSDTTGTAVRCPTKPKRRRPARSLS